MYTRCPSCRAEISFNPPANINDLPDGYKHRIKCPSCGVTIGVRIPKVETEAVIYQPQNVYATSPEPVFMGTAVEPAQEVVAPAQPAKAKSAKKPGTLRNVFMLIFSLAFIAINIVAYLINNLQYLPEQIWAYSITTFDGISGFSALVNNFEEFAAMFTSLESEEGFFLLINGVLMIASMATFILACINALVSLLALIGKKYARGWFVFSSLLMTIFVWAIILVPAIITGIMNGEVLATLSLLFTDETAGLLTVTNCFTFAIVLWISLQFIISLFFTKSLRRKNR